MSTDYFLDPSYKIPEKSNYTRFEDGENMIRILESPVLGWELWVNKKPLRRRMNEAFTMEELNNADINTFTGQKKTPQHFWAMVIWNYDQKGLQIWEVTQKGIMRDLKNLSASKWGNPKEFDLSIMKSGEKKDTVYSLLPNPKELVSKEILEAFKTAQIDVNKLFSGEDPFGGQKAEYETNKKIIKEAFESEPYKAVGQGFDSEKAADEKPEF